jgi:hypothetical protein
VTFLLDCGEPDCAAIGAKVGAAAGAGGRLLPATGFLTRFLYTQPACQRHKR